MDKCLKDVSPLTGGALQVWLEASEIEKGQSKRRHLRNYYAAICMGLHNPADADLGKKALDELIRENEAAIIEEEAR